MELDYFRLGMNIRRYRKKRNLTIEKLAEKVEISDSFMGLIERGQSIPSLETIVNIANALGTGTDALLGYDLQAVTTYLSEDIQSAVDTLPEENRKRFLEFILTNVSLLFLLFPLTAGYFLAVHGNNIL